MRRSGSATIACLLRISDLHGYRRWGLSGGRDARIMVANMSANAVTADVFLDFQGQRHPSAALAFNPNETKVLSVAQMLGDLSTSPSQAPEGGITIIQRGANPSLVAQGKVTDPVTGFSSTLEFPDPARQAASALHAVGLPVGTPPAGSPYAGTGSFTPHVIARNLSDQPQFLTVTVEYPQGAAWNSTNWPGGSPKPMVRYAGLLRKGQANPNDAFNHPNVDPSSLTGQMTLPPLAVSAYGTVDFSLAAIMNQLPQPLAYCSIRIQYNGAPGTMIAQVSSVDASQDLVVDAPMANEGDGWAGSGANPWHLDPNTESILFLTDESDKPARIGFSVTGNGVRYYLTSLQLAPHETRAIDLRQLRDAQIADFQNSRIPTVSTDGSVTWVRMDNVPVAGRLVVISRSGGIASNYDCQTCNCPITLSSVGVTPGTCAMVPGGSMQCTATANYQNCNGYPFPSDVTDSSTWSSNNTSVSTVNITGLETIQGGGTSTITASYRGATSYTYNCLKGCVCIEHDNSRSGSHGTTGQVATFLWPKSRTAPNYTVCLGLSCEIDTYYQVLDQNKNPVNKSGMSVAEGLAVDPSTQCIPTFGNPATWTTDSTGTITIADAVYQCCPMGQTCSVKADQSFKVNGSSVLVLSADKNTSGSYQVIGVSCNNGQGTCPSWAPQP